MIKNKLLRELIYETYITLKPSSIHGIGVFAICDIPKKSRNFFSKNRDEWIKISITEVEQLPTHSKNLIETYCLYDEENYFVPNYGFKVMDLVNYLNHSKKPNIISINDGEYFEAIRDIKCGEELLIDYGEIVDGVDDYN